MIVPIYAEETKNPSLTINTLDIEPNEFNKIAREVTIENLDHTHAVSWQVTIDNDLLYANPNGNAVLRFYDAEIPENFIEIGMGSPPDNKFWAAANLPENGYVVVHQNTERGWIPTAKVIVSYTDRAGLTINNGERIVVSNLDIGVFAINAYSVHGKEGSTDPPAINSGSIAVELLSGDPAQNVFHLFPFYVTAAVGCLVAILFVSKRRSS